LLDGFELSIGTDDPLGGRRIKLRPSAPNRHSIDGGVATLAVAAAATGQSRAPAEQHAQNNQNPEQVSSHSRSPHGKWYFIITPGPFAANEADAIVPDRKIDGAESIPSALPWRRRKGQWTALGRLPVERCQAGR
jgi:hypothetical protein